MENKKANIDENSKNKKIKILISLIILLIISIAGIIIAKIVDGDCEKMNNSNSGTIVDYDIYNPNLMPAKPIIYLYPTQETEVSVKLGNPEKITCSYPKYVDGWNVVAKPNGTLIHTETGRELYSLYWEGKAENTKVNYTEGFVVKGENTISFLEEKLEILGLNEKEAEEFIIYWLPKMEKNKYNYIRFASMKEIEEYMPLEVNPKPDTIIRVLMEFKGLDKYVEIPEQKLETTTRKGFVVIEWGGSEL